MRSAARPFPISRHLGRAALVASWACAATQVPVGGVPHGGAWRDTGLRAAQEPTVRGARLFPEILDEAHGWGIEPGGGERTFVAGIRLVSMPDGSMRVAPDRLPSTPSRVVALPERLGGGFVFAVGTRLWGARAWLEGAIALFVAPSPIDDVLVGLDRIYVRSPQGALIALDPRSDTRLGLGPVPATPNLGQLAAFDAWRAVAVADLRGTLLTLDAGATWRPLPLPIDPSQVVLLGDVIAVRGLDEGREVAWWAVRSDGQTGRVPSAPPGAVVDRAVRPVDAAARAFGRRPLVSAIEDGWPLDDGTALVARDGSLGRVRLDDGALVEAVADAFPMRPARCHPLSLGYDPVAAVGFVCGEPRGRTAVYRWDAPAGRLVELRGFDTPRELLGFGNGALAARGSCDSRSAGEAEDEQAWCVARRGASWRDARFPRDRLVVVLADGRVALVRPPRGGDLSTLQLGVNDATSTANVAVTLPPLQPDVARALGLGTWMDGFEERRPGVVGGWVDAAGALVGVEIAADGEVRVGEYIRDAGSPVAGGRWAFGWTASRRGFETTDGGMTWNKEIALPDPIASGRAIHERICGPVGCMAAGWLRVGWGAPQQPLVGEPPPYHAAPPRPAPTLDLVCDAVEGTPPAAARARRISPAARAVPAGVYAVSTWGAVSEFPLFAGQTGPAVPHDDLGYAVEANSGLEHAPRALPLAEIYAWGPSTGEWDQLGRWQVRWQWLWGGWTEARSSAVTASPWTSLDAARRALVKGQGPATVWTVAAGDDPDHALLLARHTTTPVATEVFAMESDGPPVEIRRVGGDPFPDVEGAARSGGQWYVATTQSPGELSATVVWAIDGAAARELARLPRVGFESRPPLWIARQAEGRKIGVVTEGPPDDLLRTRLRWVVGVDVDSGSVGLPEPLVPSDLSDRTIVMCSGEDEGWEVDVPWPERGTVRVQVGSYGEAALQAPVVRMRLSEGRGCVERLLGAVDRYASTFPESVASHPLSADPPSRRPRSVRASVVLSGARTSLRCATR